MVDILAESTLLIDILETLTFLTHLTLKGQPYLPKTVFSTPNILKSLHFKEVQTSVFRDKKLAIIELCTSLSTLTANGVDAEADKLRLLLPNMDSKL